MKYLIIGTAGHVDHGKTLLIKALSGVDTDRLKEEKLRGISIDLGFASLRLGEGLSAGIVDVPGHERFLKNMLAGTGGIDVAMLVVAADEGVMPQTREHLAMLHLYGVRHGLVVLNKIDKVDAEWLDLIDEELDAVLEDTFLATAPRCRVSALTGEGLDRLRQVLAEVAAKAPARDSFGPFRMWIDRSFVVKGYGVVATGSVLSGQVKPGEAVTLYPSGRTVRVRGVEWHGAKADSVRAGQRAAINVSGADTHELARGMFLGAGRHGQVARSWDGVVNWRESVPAGTRVRLHLGTGEFLGRIYPFREGEGTAVRLVAEEAVPAGAGDRGILRLYSPQRLLGGIMLTGPAAGPRLWTAAHAAFAKAVGQGDLPAAAAAVAEMRPRPLLREDFVRALGFVREQAVDKAVDQVIAAGRIRRLDGFVIGAAGLGRTGETMQRFLGDYHRKNPDRPGPAKEVLRQVLGLEERSLEAVLGHWERETLIRISGGEVSLAAHASRHGGWTENLAGMAGQVFPENELINVDVALIAEKFQLSADKARAAHAAMVQNGTLVRVGEMHVYSKTIQYTVRVLATHFQSAPTLTVAEFRDKINTTRKFALPLMEYFDMHKYTVRDGDFRRQGPKIRNLSENI